MHRFALLLLFGTGFSLLTFAHESNKYVPAFLVVSSEKDPTLNKTEAVFEFEFMNPDFKTSLPDIQFSVNGKQHAFKLTKTGIHTLKVAPGSYVFQFYATANYFEIYSDSVTIQPGYRTKVQLRFDRADMPIMVDKPVIYLYPPTDLEASVTVKPTGTLTFAYPIYTDGWKGTAHPDGSMTIGGRTYPYLFWEAQDAFHSSSAERTSGFIVPAEQTVAFLEEKLTAMGLNDRERTDFITYWGPRMIANPSNFVHFVFNDACNQFAELTIDPQPAQLFRVYMLWAPAEAGMTVTPQDLPAIHREHFYVLEWGGSELPSPILTSNR